MAELIAQREQEETLQREAEERLAAEQAARAEEDARLRELYPLPEDEDEKQDSFEESGTVNGAELVAPDEKLVSRTTPLTGEDRAQ